MKLIRWIDSKGHKGSCNAHCYNATAYTGKSTCICGGMNRGRGLKIAVQNTQIYYSVWVQQREKEKKCTIEVKLAPICQYIQPSLWDI